MTFRAFAAAAALALCVSPAAFDEAAAQNFPNATQMLNGFTPANLSAVAQDLGYKSEQVVYSNGVAGLSITTPQGYVFFASPTVCNPTCHGLDIYALFGPDTGVPLAAINRFNVARAMTKAFTTSNQIVLSRYVIADFGTPRGNVASEFHNFIAIAVSFAEYLEGGANTISADASAAAGKIAAPGAESAHAPAVAASFAPVAGAEEATLFLDALIAAGDARKFTE